MSQTQTRTPQATTKSKPELEEIKRRLRVELENLAYRIFVPVGYADLVEFVKDALSEAFNTNADNIRVETGLVIRDKVRHKSAFSERDEIIEARGLFYIRAEVFADRTYQVRAEFKAHFVTVPNRSAHIIFSIDPPHEVTLDIV